jgi:CheY-like chemotaxis protein
MSDDIRRSREAGFEFHLTKPVDAAELRSVLRKLNLKSRAPRKSAPPM